MRRQSWLRVLEAYTVPHREHDNEKLFFRERQGFPPPLGPLRVRTPPSSEREGGKGRDLPRSSLRIHVRIGGGECHRGRYGSPYVYHVELLDPSDDEFLVLYSSNWRDVVGANEKQQSLIENSVSIPWDDILLIEYSATTDRRFI